MACTNRRGVGTGCSTVRSVAKVIRSSVASQPVIITRREECPQPCPPPLQTQPCNDGLGDKLNNAMRGVVEEALCKALKSVRFDVDEKEELCFPSSSSSTCSDDGRRRRRGDSTCERSSNLTEKKLAELLLESISPVRRFDCGCTSRRSCNGRRCDFDPPLFRNDARRRRREVAEGCDCCDSCGYCGCEYCEYSTTTDDEVDVSVDNTRIVVNNYIYNDDDSSSTDDCSSYWDDYWDDDDYIDDRDVYVNVNINGEDVNGNGGLRSTPPSEVKKKSNGCFPSTGSSSSDDVYVLRSDARDDRYDSILQELQELRRACESRPANGLQTVLPPPINGGVQPMYPPQPYYPQPCPVQPYPPIQPYPVQPCPVQPTYPPVQPQPYPVQPAYPPVQPISGFPTTFPIL